MGFSNNLNGINANARQSGRQVYSESNTALTFAVLAPVVHLKCQHHFIYDDVCRETTFAQLSADLGQSKRRTCKPLGDVQCHHPAALHWQN
jgi:hypothetical protein